MAGKNGCDSVPRAADKISDGLKSLIFQVTLSKTPNTVDMEPEDATSCSQVELHWEDKDTNSPTKLSTPNMFWLKEM